MKTITVKVPATSANLGPGFDCLGLALDLWNETSFTLMGKDISIDIFGKGQDILPTDADNLVAQSFFHLYKQVNETPPAGLHISCTNNIPLGSGLGSSSAAVLTGLLGANALLGKPLHDGALIKIGAQIEGHPDNIAPACLGSLSLISTVDDELIIQTITLPPINAVVIVPDFDLPTTESRNAIPQQVALSAAVQNIGNTALVIEAFRQHDIPLLKFVMQDHLHQPYRLPLVPGAQQAIHAAQDLGAAAALSGAGPGVIAFPTADPQPVAEAMHAQFTQAGLSAEVFITKISEQGAEILDSGQ